MKKFLKYILTFISVLLIRLIPFRAPNVEPLMAVIMPVGKTYGGIVSFVFGSLSIIIYDLLTSGIGTWTFFTGINYGLIGLLSYWILKNKSGWKSYASYAVIATIAYDAITGLIPGPLFYNQPFIIALVGQIPFTEMHLLGNVSFAILLSPLLEKWLIKESPIHLTSSLKGV